MQIEPMPGFTKPTMNNPGQITPACFFDPLHDFLQLAVLLDQPVDILHFHTGASGDTAMKGVQINRNQ
jgi:hypothetical protein